MNDQTKPLHEPTTSWDARTHANLDTRIAGAVIDAIESDRVVLFCQPVCGTGDLGEVLYFECLVRLLREDRQTLEYPGSFIPSLERLGMMQCLDRHVVRLVIGLLKTHPHLCLGANISAQSAAEDEWWESTFAQLSMMPDVAQRLVIEITETAPLDVAAGRAFMRRVQRLGCRVAIDDFGTGFSIETGAQICFPDVVKIAGELLAGNGDRGARDDELARLVSLARDLAPCVVLEGVESAHALEVAREAGVGFVQGYYVGKPQNLAVHVPREPVCSAGRCDSAAVSGNEMNLVPFVQLSDLIMESEITRGSVSPLTGAALEDAVQLLEKNVDAIVDQSMCCKLRDHAKLAYVTGLASSVYGKHSAIAAALREEMSGVIREGKNHPERSVRVLRSIAALGRLHGQLIVCPAGRKGLTDHGPDAG
jgi:EAL domain-containing protein (putative c-di-GMP-specific phosphodiesterase class I)